MADTKKPDYTLRYYKYGEFFCEFTNMQISHVNNIDKDNRTLLDTTITFNINGVITEATYNALVDKITDMRNQLSKPRKTFEVYNVDNAAHKVLYKYEYSDNNAIASVTSPSGNKTIYTVDHGFGPMVTSFNIEQIVGNVCAFYNLQIRVKHKSCEALSGTTTFKKVSYEFGFQVDQNGLTTRTVSGQLICLPQKRPVDAYRGSVQLAVPEGFKRVSQQYNMDESQCILDFQYVDQEVYQILPGPMTDGDEVFHTSIIGGKSLVATFNGYYTFKKTTEKKDVIKKIFERASFLFAAIIKKQRNDTGLSFEVVDIINAINSNRIEFAFKSVPIEVSSAFWGANGGLPEFMTQVGITGKNSEGVPYYGTSGLAGHKTTVYDACDGSSTTSGTTVSEGSQTIGPTIDSDTSNTVKLPGQENSTQAHKDYPYLYWEQRISYECHQRKVVFEPKDVNGLPVVQTIGKPITDIIQVGRATRIGAKPDVPANIEGEVLEKDITVDTPSMGSDQKVYTVSWRYLIRTSTAANPTVYFPEDPRNVKITKEASGYTL